jgi:hypothetical protein
MPLQGFDSTGNTPPKQNKVISLSQKTMITTIAERGRSDLQDN